MKKRHHIRKKRARVHRIRFVKKYLYPIIIIGIIIVVIGLGITLPQNSIEYGIFLLCVIIALIFVPVDKTRN